MNKDLTYNMFPSITINNMSFKFNQTSISFLKECMMYAKMMPSLRYDEHEHNVVSILCVYVKLLMMTIKQTTTRNVVPYHVG